MGHIHILMIYYTGGYVIISMREEYLTYVKEYMNRLEPYMAELEVVGKWKRLERACVDNFAFEKQGLVHVFQVQEAGYTPFSAKSLS